MYKAVSPFALLPIVYIVVRFVADALSKVEPYSSCLEGFQAPAPPFYHKLRTHWIAVLGLLLAAIRLVGFPVEKQKADRNVQGRIPVRLATHRLHLGELRSRRPKQRV
ncbi:hypothetical protein MRX96_037201, partial [Rhipicephalus microplus]